MVYARHQSLTQSRSVSTQYENKPLKRSVQDARNIKAHLEGAADPVNLRMFTATGDAESGSILIEIPPPSYFSIISIMTALLDLALENLTLQDAPNCKGPARNMECRNLHSGVRCGMVRGTPLGWFGLVWFARTTSLVRSGCSVWFGFSSVRNR